MSTRTLVLPTILGLALMACGGGSESTGPNVWTPQVDSGSVTYPTVNVTPQTATLARGTRLSLFLALKGFADDGSNYSPIWSSSNPTVVQVSRLIVDNAPSTSIPSAIAYAAGVGSATITVWVAGRSASIPVTVTDAATSNP